MLTEAELKEELLKLSLFSAAYDVLTDKMALTKGRDYLALREERNRAEARYIEIFSKLYHLGYRVRYCVEKQCYQAFNVFSGAVAV